MLGEEFVKLQDKAYRQIEKIERELEKARNKVRIPALSKLRPATTSDVVEGAVFYYPKTESHNFGHWQIIDEVRWPDDDFKAYVAEDGCRYGLHGAYVLKERKSK